MQDSLTIGELSRAAAWRRRRCATTSRLGLIRPAGPAGTSAGTSGRSCGGWRSSGSPSGSGVSLEEIAEALATLPDARTPTKADWARLSARWRTRLDEQIALLERLRDRLTGCIGCGCLSLQRCRISNPDDELAAEGPGPHHLLRA